MESSEFTCSFNNLWEVTPGFHPPFDCGVLTNPHSHPRRICTPAPSSFRTTATPVPFRFAEMSPCCDFGSLVGPKPSLPSCGLVFVLPTIIGTYGFRNYVAYAIDLGLYPRLFGARPLSQEIERSSNSQPRTSRSPVKNCVSTTHHSETLQQCRLDIHPLMGTKWTADVDEEANLRTDSPFFRRFHAALIHPRGH